LTMAAVRGVLFPILQETVNFINATSLASERGITIKESRLSKEQEFVTLVELEIRTDKETLKVSGTLSANKLPRIVKINNYYVEVSPGGNMLVIHNRDLPGIIGNLGSMLAKHNINIAAMTFGRDKPGGKSISVLNIDTPASADILKQLKKIKNIIEVRAIKI